MYPKTITLTHFYICTKFLKICFRWNISRSRGENDYFHSLFPANREVDERIRQYLCRGFLLSVEPYTRRCGEFSHPPLSLWTPMYSVQKQTKQGGAGISHPQGFTPRCRFSALLHNRRTIRSPCSRWVEDTTNRKYGKERE